MTESYVDRALGDVHPPTIKPEFEPYGDTSLMNVQRLGQQVDKLTTENDKFRRLLETDAHVVDATRRQLEQAESKLSTQRQEFRNELIDIHRTNTALNADDLNARLVRLGLAPYVKEYRVNFVVSGYAIVQANSIFEAEGTVNANLEVDVFDEDIIEVHHMVDKVIAEEYNE